MASTWSTTDASAVGYTLSNSNLTAKVGSNLSASIRTSSSVSSGKRYIEILLNVYGGYNYWGFANAGFAVSSNTMGTAGHSCGVSLNNGLALSGSGSSFVVKYNPTTVTPVAGDVIGLAIDGTAGNIWLSRNGVWTNSSNPATGSLPIITFTPATEGPLFAGISLVNANDQSTLQSLAASQKYAPPAGFAAWDATAAAAINPVVIMA